jgi:hypothetical protein
VAAALGCCLFLAAWGVLHVPPLSRHQIVDTPLYQRYGDAVLDGEVPYRDFELEYPPGALPAFVLPSIAPEEHYRTAFEVLMVLCGLGLVTLVVGTAASLGASQERLYGVAALAGLAPLLLGTVVLTRFDLWPAFLTAAALAALVAGRERLGLGVLGLAAVAKIYPAVLLPLALVYVARRRGGRETLACLAAFAGVVAFVLLPFAILAPGGLFEGLGRQADRPLQVESLGAAFLAVGHQVGGYEPAVVSTHGSQNLSGELPDAVATVQAALQVLSVVGVWVLFALRRGWREELLAASAAAIAAFAAFGKVLSPQFMVWLIPLVPLVGGRIGVVAGGAFGLVLLLTQLYFPQRYWNYVAFEAGPVWTVFARDLVLVALVAVLVAAIRPEVARVRRR